MDTSRVTPEITIRIDSLYAEGWEHGERMAHIAIGDDPEERWCVSYFPDALLDEDEPNVRIWSWRPESGGFEIGRCREEWESETGHMTLWQTLDWLIARALCDREAVS